MWVVMLVLAALLLAGSPATTAGEPVLPFHATLQITEDCETSTSLQCASFWDWVSECQAKGYGWGFQVVRVGQASHLGRVTSFEQGCLEFTATGAARSNVQMTVAARNGCDRLTLYANAVFDFAAWTVPLNPPPATGTFTITGGAGRYAGARGTGTLGNVVGDFGPGTIIDLDGVLRPGHGGR
jgi:hypothetical protein